MGDDFGYDAFGAEAVATKEGERDSRAEILRRAALAGGALLGGGAVAAGMPDVAATARGRVADVRILNFLLLIEHLQAEFYGEAAAAGALRGELRTFARTVGSHERRHVAALRRVLRGQARRKPTFDFGNAVRDPDEFANTALELEELGASAYIGQGANLSGRTVALAASITAVEARHTAWIRDFVGKHPAPRPADPSLTGKQVLARIRKLGFVKDGSQ